MKLHILQWLINALAIIVAVRVVDGLSFTGPWWYMLIIGTIFGIVNSLIKPIIKFFSIPIIIITLGVFSVVINAAMLGITALISRPLELGFEISGFWPALWGALIVSIVSALLSWVTGKRHLEEIKKREGKNA
ncbi:MAG: phage holin family protein [Nitrospirota bacterium]|nr:MAG: phage holin family protein [Nitrospirota bacterium]